MASDNSGAWAERLRAVNRAFADRERALVDSLRDATAELDALGQQLASQRQVAQDLQRTLADASECGSTAERDRDDAREQLAQAQRQLAEAQEATRAAQQQDAAREQQLSTSQQQLSTLQHELAQLAADRTELAATLQTHVVEREALTARLESIVRELDGLRTAHAALTRRSAEQADELLALRQHETALTAARSAAEEALHRASEAHQAERQRVRAELDALQAALQAARSDAKAQADALARLTAERRDLAQAHARAQEEIAALSTRLQSQEALREAAAAEHARRLDQRDAALTRLRAELRAVELARLARADQLTDAARESVRTLAGVQEATLAREAHTSEALGQLGGALRELGQSHRDALQVLRSDHAAQAAAAQAALRAQQDRADRAALEAAQALAARDGRLAHMQLEVDALGAKLADAEAKRQQAESSLVEQLHAAGTRASAVEQELQSRLQALQQQSDNRRTEFESLLTAEQGRAADALSELNAVRAALASTERQLDLLRTEKAAAESTIRTAHEELAALQRLSGERIGVLEAALDASRRDTAEARRPGYTLRRLARQVAASFHHRFAALGDDPPSPPPLAVPAEGIDPRPPGADPSPSGPAATAPASSFPMPTKMNGLSHPAAVPIRHVDDLLALFDESFVAAAYRTVLKREPDPVGFADHLREVRRGDPKERIVVGMAVSAEGRLAGRDLPGLDLLVATVTGTRTTPLRRLVNRLRGRDSERLDAQIHALANQLSRQHAQSEERLGAHSTAMQAMMANLEGRLSSIAAELQATRASLVDRAADQQAAIERRFDVVMEQVCAEQRALSKQIEQVAAQVADLGQDVAELDAPAHAQAHAGSVRRAGPAAPSRTAHARSAVSVDSLMENIRAELARARRPQP